MKDVFARLGADFFSTILFLAIYLATDNVLLATGVAIAGAVAQVIYARVKGKELGYMTWASLALVIVLGSATLLTHDPRFVLAKPAIGHFAIGFIMLKRGWMLRYMPPIALETAGDMALTYGYVWSALMFASAILNLVLVFTLDPLTWSAAMSVWGIASKLTLFLVQFANMRIVGGRRRRAKLQGLGAGEAAAAAG